MKIRFILIEQYGEVTFTNNPDKAQEYLEYSNYRVVDTDTGRVFHESGQDDVKEQV